MPVSARYLFPALAALGFLSGHALRVPRETATIAAEATEEAPRPRLRPGGMAAAAPDPQAAARIAGMKSADTVADLLAIDDAGELYARLALWQLDAPLEDLAAFWASYAKREGRDTGVIDLLFTQWTRSDPQGAIAAAKGSGHEGIPWWAWAVHDPDAAIAAVREAQPEMSGFVMRAVGQYHPERSLQVLEENPGFNQWNAIEGIIDGLTRTDPEAALEFQRKHGRLHDTDAIKKLTRDDPYAALEWIRERPADDHYSESAFLKTLADEDPAMLGELAATLPPGQFRRKLENAAFAQLAKDDPAEALRQAKAETTPRLAAERLAMVGQKMVDDDLPAALAVLDDLFKACPDAGNRMVWTRYPNGASGGGGGVDGVQPFIDRLVAKDPLAALAAVEDLPPVENSPYGHRAADAESMIAASWARQDFEGFAGWVENQDPGPQRDRHVGQAVSQLISTERHADAVSWAMGISDEDQRLNSVRNAVQQWRHRDADAARAWAAEADLSDTLRQSLEPYLR
jgi:hypothetical protein